MPNDDSTDTNHEDAGTITKIVVVDDEALVRAGVVEWLQSIKGVDVVGEAGSAKECLTIIGDEVPDVLMVDVGLPGTSGIDLIKQVTIEFPEIVALVLSGTTHRDTIIDAFESGARGYVPKMTSAEEIKQALGNVLTGKWYLSPEIAQEVIQSLISLRREIGSISAEDGQDGGGKKGDRPKQQLEQRELEVLKMLAEGMTLTAIAEVLEVNIRTVERVRSKIEKKLHAKNLADLIRYAIKRGLITP